MELIKFEQDRCQPCKLVSTYLDSKNVQYEPINVEDEPERAGQYSIMSVPVTILLDDNGMEVKRSIGFQPVELDEMITKL